MALLEKEFQAFSAQWGIHLGRSSGVCRVLRAGMDPMLARRAILAVFSFGTNRTFVVCYTDLTIVIMTLGVRH